MDKYSTVTVEGSHYSVPDDLVGKEVEVRTYTDKIVIYYRNRITAGTRGFSERTSGRSTSAIT